MRRNMRRTVIIGGGAAGMTAAIVAAGEGDAVTLLEHTDRLGRKLLSTGNGRCNLTNRRQGAKFYHSENPDFPLPALGRFGFSETLCFFETLGLFFKERDGYVYPRSSQAQTVRDALLAAILGQGVDVRTECRVTKIEAAGRKAPERKTLGSKPAKNGREDPEGSDGAGRFLVRTQDISFAADAVILACGGMAAPFTGSDGSGYGLAKALGHRLVLPVPALTGLFASSNPLRKAAGVRTDGTILLYVGEGEDKRLVCQDTGELQITDYGISGIPVFQVSRHASRALSEGIGVSAALHFLPEYGREEAKDLIFRIFRTRTDADPSFLPDTGNRDCMQVLCGLFPEKLAAVLLKRAGIPLHAPAGHPGGKQLQKLSELVCGFPLEISAAGDFSRAQVTAGGIDTREVWAETMESKLVPGLFFAGEILDVDGDCGGYNLQWAWASGFLAGKQGRP